MAHKRAACIVWCTQRPFTLSLEHIYFIQGALLSTSGAVEALLRSGAQEEVTVGKQASGGSGSGTSHGGADHSRARVKVTKGKGARVVKRKASAGVAVAVKKSRNR